MKRSSVTASDVARAAGVSQATVSYVLNNNPKQKIPEETRQRVRQAMADLRYTPSYAARALSRGKSELVLLLLPQYSLGSMLTGLMERLNEQLEQQGLSLIARTQQHGRALSASWRDVMPGAIIALDCSDNEEIKAMRAAGVYVINIVIGEHAAQDQFTIALPQKLIGLQQVRYLAERGHRHLGYAATCDLALSRFQAARLQGAQQACAELGLPPPHVCTVANEIESAAEAVSTWMKQAPRITAACAYNDDLAFALLAGARSAQVAVPDDIALIGVDDVPLARFACPPLTTISLGPGRSTASVVRAVVDGIAGKTLQHLPLDAHEIIRRDTA